MIGKESEIDRDRSHEGECLEGRQNQNAHGLEAEKSSCFLKMT